MPVVEEARDVVVLDLEALIEKELVSAVDIVFGVFQIWVRLCLILKRFVFSQHLHVAVLSFGDGGWDTVLGLDELLCRSAV